MFTKLPASRSPPARNYCNSSAGNSPRTKPGLPCTGKEQDIHTIPSRRGKIYLPSRPTGFFFSTSLVPPRENICRPVPTRKTKLPSRSAEGKYQLLFRPVEKLWTRCPVPSRPTNFLCPYLTVPSRSSCFFPAKQVRPVCPVSSRHATIYQSLLSYTLNHTRFPYRKAPQSSGHRPRRREIYLRACAVFATLGTRHAFGLTVDVCSVQFNSS